MVTKKKHIPFRLVNIEEKQYSVFEETLESEEPIEQQIRTGFGVNPENQIISASILYFLKKGEKPLLKMELSCYFEIKEKPFKEDVLKENTVHIPTHLARHLADLTSGTLRGALFAKTQNTPFAQYPMRLINLTDIIKKDVVIEIEKNKLVGH